MTEVISLSLPPQPIDPVIIAMIRRSGRSWWQAIYKDGRVLSEWDTLSTLPRLPLGDSSSSHWESVNKDGMVGLRLLCPNGMCGHLKAPEGHRFIQLKAAHLDIGPGGASRGIDAHIIGVIMDTNGNCFCRSWEYQSRQLIEFYDNVFQMKYLNIGKLSLEVQGVKL